jgi:myo-inositol-1(or 4)-monophosphatase
MKDYSLDELLAVATRAALEAGELVRTKFTGPRQISEKGFRDLVTDADTASQQLIVDIIRSHFPDHGFLVEEEAVNLPASGPIIWVIDPVDGTTNYSHQVPIYSISIAAITRPSPPSTLEEPQILVGVIYDPTRNELFHAAAGQGAFLNSTKIQVSSTAALERAILSIDWSHNPAKRQITLDMIQHIAHQVQTLRAIGSAATALAWVAAGRLDAYFNLNLKPWDVAAGKLLIEEAGGRLTSMNDQPWHFEDVGCAAANGRLFAEFKTRLQQVNAPDSSQPG